MLSRQPSAPLYCLGKGKFYREDTQLDLDVGAFAAGTACIGLLCLFSCGVFCLVLSLVLRGPKVDLDVGVLLQVTWFLVFFFACTFCIVSSRLERTPIYWAS